MKRFKSYYLLIIPCLLLASCLITSCANDKTLVTSGFERTIYPDMIGVNGNLIAFNQPWDNANLVNAVGDLQVPNFRYPAGSLGNYWDWDTGWIDKSVPDSLMIKWVAEKGLKESTDTYTLENFAKGQKKLGFTPVFMLNMLSKDLAHAVRNLLRAKKLGLPVKYIELGNELYFNLPFEMSVYPTPEDYGKTCQIWIDSLKQHFPNAKYAVLGTDLERRARHTDWTRRALKYCNNADAVIFHKYSPAGIDGSKEIKKITAGTEGTSDALTATRKAPSKELKVRQEWEIGLLQNDSAYANMLQTAHEAAYSYTKVNVPVGMEIWATEFNMRDDRSAIRGTWANTLYISKYYEEFLNSPVSLTNIHNISGDLFGQIFSDDTQLDFIKWKHVKSKPWQLTAAGISTHLFANASKGMTLAKKLAFSKSFDITNDRGDQVETLGGWLFENESSKKMLLINYSRKDIALDLSSYPFLEKATQYFSPIDTYITNGFSDVKKEEGSIKREVTLKPFSITIIQ
ncbi:hypothetical protein [Tamlana sp. I1]|uniref:hypothetical protein n=1 Tax=Tamlana sp. I1 TaxID=2762061 RepID=UPI00189039DC|nr:hypothetical protein [Tamlana sp. I1]